MAAIGMLGYARLVFLSQPKHERQLYQQVRRRKVQRMVEVGIGSAKRAIHLIETAQRYSRGEAVSYTGFDWFEERESGAEPLPLIHAHRQLQLTGGRVRLVPGFPPATLPQLANSLQRTDMILLSHRVDDDAMHRAWYYMPRMCHSETLVLREVAIGDNEFRFDVLSIAELERRSADRTSRQAA